MTAAAFRATIHGLKTVPTRKVCQLTVEFPIEQLAQVALIAEHGAWVGIARIQEPAQQEVSASAEPDKERRKFDELPPPQQAGILCGSNAFRTFLKEKFPNVWLRSVDTIDDPYVDGGLNEIAAIAIRELCQVKSRAHITEHNVEFKSLLLAYRLWQNHPELEDAH